MKSTKQTLILTLTVAFGLTALTASAATVSLTPYASSSDWPSSADLSTVDPFPITHASGGLRANNSLEQSFTLNSALTVGTIDLAINGYDPSVDYEVRFFQMGGSGANSTSLTDWQISNASFTGTQIGNTISITSEPASAQTGNLVLQISLSPSEQVALSAGQYLLACTDLSGTSVNNFAWALSNDSTDYYPGGRYFDGSIKSQQAYRDYGLAFEAAPVPEPASGALLALGGGLGFLFLRRRRA